MKVQLLDMDENVVHEFDVTHDPSKNVDYDSIIHWEPTGKYYKYFDQAQDDLIQFQEGLVVTVSPTIGGQTDA